MCAKGGGENSEQSPFSKQSESCRLAIAVVGKKRRKKDLVIFSPES